VVVVQNKGLAAAVVRNKGLGAVIVQNEGEEAQVRMIQPDPR